MRFPGNSFVWGDNSKLQPPRSGSKIRQGLYSGEADQISLRLQLKMNNCMYRDLRGYLGIKVKLIF
jgi:hypothetical protein